MINPKLEFIFLGMALVCSLIGFAFFVLKFLFKGASQPPKPFKEETSLESPIIFGLIFLCLLISLVLRGLHLGRVPCSNLYESLIIFACGMACIVAFFIDRYKLTFLNWPACLIIITLLASAIWLPSSQKEAVPLLPALNSYWRTILVPALLISYGFLAISGICSVLYLIEDYKLSKLPPSKGTESNKLNFFGEAIYRCTSFGFPLLTFGIVTGALWANHSWGNLWQWDPKENLALVTWFCYGAYLHLKLSGKASGRTLAWLNAVGVLAIYMTYIGINQFDLGGLHTYGKV